MRPIKQTSGVLIIVGCALVLGACQTKQAPELKPNTSVPTDTQATSKTASEKPSLTGQIEHVSMYPVPNRPDDLAVSLVVSLHNAGAPSTAQGWNLEVTSPGKPATTAAAVHVNGQVEMPGSNGRKVDLATEDLVLKTAKAPVAQNGIVNGILTFVLTKTSERVLANNKTSLTVHFKDAQGNSYHTPQSVIGEKAAKPVSSPRP